MPNLTTETPTYYCILTDAGAALEASAHAQGKTVRLRTVSVGDGGGSTPTPDRTATALVHENYRKAIDSLTPDPDNSHICWVHMIIPADVGDWYIREVAVWADPLEDGGDPVLYAVGNHPDFYKPKTVMGQAMTHELSLGIVVSSAANVTLVVSDEGYATKIEVGALNDALERNAINDIVRAKNMIRLSDRLTRHELNVCRGTSIQIIENINEGCECGHVDGGVPLTIDPITTFETALYGDVKPGAVPGEAAV